MRVQIFGLHNAIHRWLFMRYVYLQLLQNLFCKFSSLCYFSAYWYFQVLYGVFHIFYLYKRNLSKFKLWEFGTVLCESLCRTPAVVNGSARKFRIRRLPGW